LTCHLQVDTESPRTPCWAKPVIVTYVDQREGGIMAAKRERETTDFAGFVRRSIKAHGKRVAGADEVDLAELVALHNDVDQAIATAVQGMRERGESWAYIARGLGVTRQYAQRTYGKVSA
jgi:hypothetical protein